MNASSHPVPDIERLHGGRPIVSPIPEHPWESRVTFNPACALVENRQELDLLIPTLPFDEPTKRNLLAQQALCFLLYRAQGDQTPSADWTHSSVGLAILTPALKLLARHDRPVMVADHAFDNLGVEDGRITRVGNRYIMFYTAYSAGPSGNEIRIASASTTDFVHWEKHGVLQGDFNREDNKNAMLFNAAAGGRYFLLHRPMKGPNAMSIHWAEGADPAGPWKSRGLLMPPLSNPEFIDTWVGGGAPPLQLPDGRFLAIYHIGNRKADQTREYDLGIAVLDPLAGNPVLRRDEPLLRPTTPAETAGDPTLGVNNVVFICGAYFFEGDLYFPYAGADSVVLAGKISRPALEKYLG